MSSTLFDLVLQGKESPNSYPKYRSLWEINSEGKTLSEYLGILEKDLIDLENHHSFSFVIYRTVHRKHLLDRVYPGAYVQFVVEYDDQIPHSEYGWVDSFNKEKKVAELQCDDSYFGNRSIEINLRDIIQILPTKERPNIFFKAMLCKGCNNCSHDSGEFVDNCPFFILFSKIKNNRSNSKNIIGEIVRNEKPVRKTSGVEGRTSTSSAKQNDIPLES